MVNSPIQSSFDHDESEDCLSGRSSSSSSMNSCFSGNVREEEEEDECFDNWEAVADALNADDNVVSKSPSEHEMPYTSVVPETAKNPGVDLSKPEFSSAVPVSHLDCRAWKLDDVFHSQCLSNLSNQHNSPLNSDWYGNHKAIAWAWQSIISQDSQCPICYVDLDVKDSTFLPCSCAFRLCVFCHRKILEADGRCPGCRKLYDLVDGNAGFNIATKAFHSTQSCSMSTRC